MRSRLPLLASRASRSTVALMRRVCENRRVDAHGLYEMSSIKGVGNKGVASRRPGRRNTIAVENMRAITGTVTTMGLIDNGH